jgi:hypothetical protein
LGSVLSVCSALLDLPGQALSSRKSSIPQFTSRVVDDKSTIADDVKQRPKPAIGIAKILIEGEADRRVTARFRY